LRDFGQPLEDLYRRAYTENPDIVEENAIKAFLDKCGQSEDVRLAIKRTRSKTLQEAVVNAMQEACLRVSEDLAREKPANRAIYEVEDGMEKMCMITDASGSPKGRFY
jgi:predicted metalloprotease